MHYLVLFFCPNLWATESLRWKDAQITSTLSREWSYHLDTNKMNQWQLAWQPNIRLPTRAHNELNAAFRARLNAIDNFTGDDADQSEVSDLSRFWDLGSGAQLELREFRYRIKHHSGYSTLGKQQVVWGISDGIKVLDMVNPQSFRTFILDDPGQSRIPLWMLNTELLFEQWGFQMLLIPDNSYHDFPQQGRPFAYRSPLLIPQIAAGVPVTIQKTQRPNGADLGWRVSSFVSGWDMTVNYLSHYDDTPVIRRFIDSSGAIPTVTVSPEYARTQLLGGSLSNTFGGVSLRLEGAYQTDKFFLVDDNLDLDGVEQTDEWAYVIGLDYAPSSSQLMGLQVHQSILSDSTAPWTRDPTESHLTFHYLQKSFHERLSLDNRIIVNLNREDGLVQSQARFELRDNLIIWLGLDLFFGDETGIFGQFDQQDRVTSGIEIGLD